MWTKNIKLKGNTSSELHHPKVKSTLFSSAINIQSAFILNHSWHKRHGVKTPATAEISHLGPLVLILVIDEDVLQPLIPLSPSTCQA